MTSVAICRSVYIIDYLALSVATSWRWNTAAESHVGAVTDLSKEHLKTLLFSLFVPKFSLLSAHFGHCDRSFSS